MEESKRAQRVSLVNLAGNAVLTLFKLTVGLLAGSGALISDGVNSASDVLSTLIVLAGVALAGKEADKEHPYGHDRFECVAGLLLAMILFFTGVSIGWSAVKDIFCAGGAMESPGGAALAAAVVCIGAKEWMYRYTMAAAKKLGSVALKASAWDHRSDSISSLGVFAGILGARLGFPVLDRLAGLLVCGLILRSAVAVFREAVSKTVDRACDDETAARLCQTVECVEGVSRIDVLRTRQFGSGIYMDVEIAVDGRLSLTEAHAIADQVHDAVEAAEPAVRHCMVHVNPAE